MNKNTLVSTHPVFHPPLQFMPMTVLSAKADFTFHFDLRVETELGARFRPTVYGRKEVVINMEAFESQLNTYCTYQSMLL